MPAITIYLNDRTDQVVAKHAESSGLSKSRWISKVLNDYASDKWPNGWIELAGSFEDFPLREEFADETLSNDADRIDF